ncbi:hypothetical protein L227DRAFT_195754 [Lentinus tigrinus ALCF2SS1-6]|uniref:Uncharacterized protein n=1 Tax=Lentinus tigrinus ALCF2SS1-6 TaxID=1328759 RepID=A0A5C2S3I4_9APHY|nr:hypothetical protein L227DRAFT_195754 [Lentinus tigrinus ALCF2SS1-6]
MGILVIVRRVRTFLIPSRSLCSLSSVLCSQVASTNTSTSTRLLACAALTTYLPTYTYLIVPRCNTFLPFRRVDATQALGAFRLRRSHGLSARSILPQYRFHYTSYAPHSLAHRLIVASSVIRTHLPDPTPSLSYVAVAWHPRNRHLFCLRLCELSWKMYQ